MLADGNAGRPTEFPLTRDEQDIEFKYIGKRGLTRKDGYDKATGHALYTRDISFQGMLYGKVLGSPYARAKIISMDTSESEKVPGVRCILRYDDPELLGKELNGSLPGPDWVRPEATLLAKKPFHLLLGDIASYEGQNVGLAVFADDEEAADEAIRLAKIEWDVQKPYMTIQDALAPDAEILRPNADSNITVFHGEVKHGNWEKALAESDHVIEFDARRNPYSHALAEMPNCICRWWDSHLEIWSGEQQPYHAQQIVAEALDLPMSKVIFHVPYLGAAFGGRGNPAHWHSNGLFVLAAIASKRTGRPCKCMFDRRQTMMTMSEDAGLDHIKVGFDDDGTINVVDGVCYYDVHNSGLDGTIHFWDNTKVPNIHNVWGGVDINKPPAWWCRCEQTSNLLVTNLVFDMVADYLNMDPTELAIKNDGVAGHDAEWLREFKKEHNFPDRDSLVMAIEAGKKAFGWDEKYHPPGTRKLPNGRMHGIDFIWTHNWDDSRGHGSAGVLVEDDGTVSIYGMQADLGVNGWSPYCAIVADEIGVDYEDVNIHPWTTESAHMLMSPDGSTAMIANAFIVREAARKCKKALQEFAAGEIEGIHDPDNIVVEGKFIYDKTEPDKKYKLIDIVKEAQPMSTCATIAAPPVYDWGWHIHGASGFALETGRPRMTRQCHFVEVEVDTETGYVYVSKIVNVNDVGKCFSPEGTETQMTGGDYVGAGRQTFEEFVWDKRTGIMLNSNLLDYKIPLMNDVGEIIPVIQESELGWGPYGSCGVGESTPSCIASQTAGAIYNAIGKWITEFPITPKRVLDALNADD